jgi:hypothetical protein
MHVGLQDKRRKDAVNKQRSHTSFKNKDQDIAERWDYNVVEYNPELFEPSWLNHVSQRQEGNCLEYHVKIGENPCTSWKKCEVNNEGRKQWFSQQHKGIKQRKREARDSSQQERDSWELSEAWD